MKINLYITIIFIIAAFSNCTKKSTEPAFQEKVCNTNNPVKDLVWMKAKIDSSINHKGVLEICSYDNQGERVFSIFLYEITLDDYKNQHFSESYGGYYYNCQGKKLCSISSGIVYINTCSKSFSDNLTNRKLIYLK